MQRTFKVGSLEISTPWSYYWIVKGKIPLKLAEELYKLDISKKIRVAGHCEAPPPELPWVQYYCKETKRPLISIKEFDETKKELEGIKSEEIRKSTLAMLDKFTTVEDVTVGDGFVELYNIDDESSLTLFLKKCGEYGLLTG